MAARAYSGKKPKNLKHTLRVFLSYLGRHKKMLAVVAVLVTISAGANLLGTYMIRPVVNGLADGDVHTLLCGVLITALIFGCGALAAYGYTQTMVKAAQQVVFDIRRDLFEHVQTLPLQFFDSRRHGDIMSLFANDIDTMADALNNSFAMVIQSFIQIVGTLTLLYILNWRLSLIVTVCYGIMFWYIKFSGKRSKGYYTKQQNSLGELNGYIEELITGQKAVTTKAKKSVANFKIREGMPIGCKVTLRGEKMYEFVDRLINLALPRVRDFRGVNPNAFDGRGNYALGIKEQLIFPEIEYDKIDKTRGMDIIFVTTAKTDEEARELLAQFNMPFAK